MYPNAYPKAQTIQPEPTITLREHHELMQQTLKDALLGVLALAVVAMAVHIWRKRRTGWD